jgi:hypothetical protein
MIILPDEIYRQIMWDYPIPKEDLEKLLSGETDHAGHYTPDTLFVKMLQSVSWFSIIKILGKENVLKLLTPENIKKLRFKSLQNQFTYVKSRLLEII